MIELIYSVAGFIAAVAVLVTFHEFGHFCVAKSFGIRVLTFSIGFGKPIWTHRFSRSSTELVIGAIPLGGYVRMFEAPISDHSHVHKSIAFNHKSLGIRAIVVLAGPAANFILAAIFSWIVFIYGVPGLEPIVGSVSPASVGESKGFTPGTKLIAIDGRKVESWSQHHIYLMNQVAKSKRIVFELDSLERDRHTIVVNPGEILRSEWQRGALESGLGLRPNLPHVPAVIEDVVPDSPAFDAGLKPRDRIVAINEIPISDWRSLVTSISGKPNELVHLEVAREEAVIYVSLRTEALETATGPVGRIGIRGVRQYEPPVVVKLGALEGVGAALENTWLLSILTIRAIAGIAMSGGMAENLGGPITIARAAGQSARTGLTPFLLFLAILSVSLGILNLLPIPVLDGGHLVHLLIEGVKGSALSEKALQISQLVGLTAVAALMLIAIYNDVVRLGF